MSSSTLSAMLRSIGYSVKCVERLALERCPARRAAFGRLYLEIPDRCLVVVDETHIAGPAMVRRRGRAPVGRALEALAPDPRVRPKCSSTVALSYTRGILELAVNEVPPAQNGDDFILFCVRLVRRMNAFVPGVRWAEQPDYCVLVYDNASVHTALVDMILDFNGVHRLRLSPYSPDFSAIEPAFNDYKHAVRTISYHHADLPDRIAHVLAFASLSLASVQGHYREARRQVLRNLPELTGEGRPLPGVFARLPVALNAP